MTPKRSEFPDVRRADAGVALVTPLFVATPERQRISAAEAVAVFRRRPRPAGFLSLSAFGSTDGETLLTYAQWSSDDDYRAYEARRAGTGRSDGRRGQPVRYLLHRSSVSDPAATPGMLVAPTFDVEGPERQERSIEALVDGPLSEPFPGLVASHFHASLDGTRVLNWAEWVDEAAHDAFLKSSLPAECFDAIALPGVRGLSGKRYRLLESETA